MAKVPIRVAFEYGGRDTDFVVDADDFDVLEIRDSQKPGGFHYFYDTAGRRLIKDFLLDDRPQVATLCRVTLIKKGDKYSPRIQLWKRDKTAPQREQAHFQMGHTPETRSVKALVDTDDCHDNFWRVINFLQSFADIDLPATKFPLCPART